MNNHYLLHIQELDWKIKIVKYFKLEFCHEYKYMDIIIKEPEINFKHSSCKYVMDNTVGVKNISSMFVLSAFSCFQSLKTT